MIPSPTMRRVVLGLFTATVCSTAAAQAPPPQAARDTTTGFVIRDQTTIANCRRCHAMDSAGYMSRISYLRKTPEGWETSLRRMVSLNGVKVDTAAARKIVRYLSDNQGLAPAEARPGRFESERRSADYAYTADTRTDNTCHQCHSMGRVITQRRTRPEWDLLIATHRALYPVVEFQGFRNFAPPPPDSAPRPHPMDAAVAHLSRAFPLRTQQWRAWSATMRSPRLEGTWLLSGTEAGKGRFYGQLTIAKGPTDGEFTTRASYRYAGGGPAVTRQGRSIVYTGFQWRGRSTEQGRPATDAGMREVLFVEPGWQEMSGRWFTGAYDETGMDVTMTRLGMNAVVAGVAPRALRAGTRSQAVTIFGANLPRSVATAAVDFGPGVSVDRVVRATTDSVTVVVSVDSTAAPGARDFFLEGTTLQAGVTVYRTVDRIAVTPLAGLSRVGGIVFPKQVQQFDAIAYDNGADKKPNTEDDLEIGPVPATWSMDEYGATFDDDDVKYVGGISPQGLFTPALDGPNAKRRQERNNIGDVWVVATYQPPGQPRRPLTARAVLIVTVPLYVRFEPWRTAP
ncbi:MAG TPA: quinohemoprotein amine dehydrogenase subunit alpha [Gemmatimonas sp.]|nr:quinohemoprotein amine dehydrogenase subunit alpha [Gemmatimonas sp.]